MRDWMWRRNDGQRFFAEKEFKKLSKTRTTRSTAIFSRWIPRVPSWESVKTLPRRASERLVESQWLIV